MTRLPFRLVRANLLKHPVRAVLTIGSLVVALFLLCLLRSLVVALDAGVRHARSDRVIVQSAVSLFVDLPESYLGKIQAVEGVREAMPFTWFGGYYQKRGNFFGQFAVDPERLFELYPEIELIEGSAEKFQGDRRGCIVGTEIARKYGFEVGKPIPIIGALYPRVDGQPWEFQCAAIYRSNSPNVDAGTLFFHWDYLDESLDSGAVDGNAGSVGIYVVQVEDGHEPVEVMGRIDALFENGPQRVQSTSEAEFQAQFVSMVGNVPFFVASIGGGVFFALLLAVVNTMLMAAREQTRDVGILKALGFGRTSIFLVLLCQSLLLAVLGGGLGIALAKLSEAALIARLGMFFPGFLITNETLGLALLATLVVGVIAGLAPAWRLAALSPTASLREEG